MIKIKLFILLSCLISFVCTAQMQSFNLSPLELSSDICNYLKKKKIINSNFCINENYVGFEFQKELDSTNKKSYNAYFSRFIKTSLTEQQYDSFLRGYGFTKHGDQKLTYSNKKIWIIYKPIIINNDYFVLVLKQEKSTGDMFIVHLRMNTKNKFYFVNQSGVWQ